MPIYLDYAATTPVHPEVYEAMKPYWMEEFGNPASRTHIYGQRANEAVENARKQVAAVIDAKPNEIIFTSGATESNNLAILGLAKHPENKEKKHIISSPIEHKSVLEPLEFLATQGYEVELVPMDSSGRVKVEDVVNRVRHDTLLVSIMHVNNETGVIQPIDEICKALIDHPVYVHTDAAQGFGKDIKPLTNSRIDLMSISGHKIFGPKGVGALMRRRREAKWVPIAPLMYGGDQEKKIRPGTLAAPIIIGLGKAADLAKQNISLREKELSESRDKLIKMLQDKGITINGDAQLILPGIINISIKGFDSEALMILLKKTFAISNGSACTSIEYNSSYVLLAMKMPTDRTSEAIRLSWSYRDSLDWIDLLSDELDKVMNI